MTPIDEALLEHARRAGAKVIDAEKQVQIAKAEYHAEVRRLHLAGASLREIAVALGISHQRVQQIVDEAGGSWWTRIWRTRGLGPLAATPCSFCGRPRAQVDKLISGPDVFICDGCIERAERVAKHGPQSPFAPAVKQDRARCSFCGQRQGAQRTRGSASPVVRTMLAAGTRRICSDCLGLCRRIVDESA
jgi:ribosomal protein S14